MMENVTEHKMQQVMASLLKQTEDVVIKLVHCKHPRIVNMYCTALLARKQVHVMIDVGKDQIVEATLQLVLVAIFLYTDVATFGISPKASECIESCTRIWDRLQEVTEWTKAKIKPSTLPFRSTEHISKHRLISWEEGDQNMFRFEERPISAAEVAPLPESPILVPHEVSHEVAPVVASSSTEKKKKKKTVTIQETEGMALESHELTVSDVNSKAFAYFTAKGKSVIFSFSTTPTDNKDTEPFPKVYLTAKSKWLAQIKTYLSHLPPSTQPQWTTDSKQNAYRALTQVLATVFAPNLDALDERHLIDFTTTAATGGSLAFLTQTKGETTLQNAQFELGFWSFFFDFVPLCISHTQSPNQTLSFFLTSALLVSLLGRNYDKFQGPPYGKEHQRRAVVNAIATIIRKTVHALVVDEPATQSDTSVIEDIRQLCSTTTKIDRIDNLYFGRIELLRSVVHEVRSRMIEEIMPEIKKALFSEMHTLLVRPKNTVERIERVLAGQWDMMSNAAIAESSYSHMITEIDALITQEIATLLPVAFTAAFGNARLYVNLGERDIGEIVANMALRNTLWHRLGVNRAAPDIITELTTFKTRLRKQYPLPTIETTTAATMVSLLSLGEKARIPKAKQALGRAGQKRAKEEAAAAAPPTFEKPFQWDEDSDLAALEEEGEEEEEEDKFRIGAQKGMWYRMARSLRHMVEYDADMMSAVAAEDTLTNIPFFLGNMDNFVPNPSSYHDPFIVEMRRRLYHTAAMQLRQMYQGKYAIKMGMSQLGIISRFKKDSSIDTMIRENNSEVVNTPVARHGIILNMSNHVLEFLVPKTAAAEVEKSEPYMLEPWWFLLYPLDTKLGWKGSRVGAKGFGGIAFMHLWIDVTDSDDVVLKETGTTELNYVQQVIRDQALFKPLQFMPAPVKVSSLSEMDEGGIPYFYAYAVNVPPHDFKVFNSLFQKRCATILHVLQAKGSGEITYDPLTTDTVETSAEGDLTYQVVPKTRVTYALKRFDGPVEKMDTKSVNFAGNDAELLDFLGKHILPKDPVELKSTLLQNGKLLKFEMTDLSSKVSPALFKRQEEIYAQLVDSNSMIFGVPNRMRSNYYRGSALDPVGVFNNRQQWSRREMSKHSWNLL